MTVRFAACVAAMAVSASFLLDAQVKSFRPVTEAMLRNPAPGDWLNWRRTDNAWGYSPLDQITRQNVGQLQLAWSWSMDDTGSQQATPLVYDGIMYLPNPRRHSGARCGNRRSDLGVPARRHATARTSGCATERRRADRTFRVSRSVPRPEAEIPDAASSVTSRSSATRSSARPTTRTSSPSMRARASWCGTSRSPTRSLATLHLRPHRRSRKSDRRHDRVLTLQGRRLLHQRTRCRNRKGAWRTSTVARPDEPGGDSWGELPLMFRAGSDAWIPAATIRTRISSTGERRRPSHGRAWYAVPMAPRSTPTRRSPSIPTRER